MRNLVAHNKDVITKNEVDDSIIYKPEGLNELGKQMKIFFQAYEVLAKKVSEIK